MADLLIVDDEPQARSSLRRILEDAGHTVREAGSGPEGLEAIKRARPDVLILDIIMPEMTGIELCHRIRADPFLTGLPIIFLTARS